jgi:hypothetical protein
MLCGDEAVAPVRLPIADYKVMFRGGGSVRPGNTWAGHERQSRGLDKKKPGHPGNNRVWLFLLTPLSRIVVYLSRYYYRSH